MFSKIITFIIGGLSVYFFYEYNFFIGIILLIWTISRLFGVSLQRLIKGIGDLSGTDKLEKRCNVYLDFKINLEEVLKHPQINNLYKKLKDNKKIKEVNQKDWIKKLLANYKKKYKKEDTWEEVKFNIKNNLIWKNEKIDFNDDIYHEFDIPYEYTGKDEEGSMFASKIENRLIIRLFIVNGIIKLQIGDFSKEYTPEILRDGGLAVYKTHETITKFPLMYFSYEHKIPQNYLNMSYHATNHHKEIFLKTGNKKGTQNDWAKLNNDLQNYNYVCSLADEYINDKGKWEKIIKYFEEEKDKVLKEESFKNPFARDESEDDYFAQEFLSNNDIYYQNKYLVINIVNISNYKEKKEKYTYTDYWEEMP